MAPFCSCPASLVSRKFFAVGPGCAKCFFLLRSVGAATFRRGQSKKKKNSTQGVFFAPAPGKGSRRRSPVPARGQSKKKKKTPPRVFFFCCGPGERQGKEKPRWAPARGQSKKKHHPGSGAPNGASPSPAFRRGRSKKKKHPGWCFFFCSGPVPARGFSLPCLSPGPEQKKHTLGGVFFLLRPRADAHSLTAGLGGDASPSPGWCLFFLLRPRPDRGGVFFAVAPPGRSLTHCGLGRFRQGPGGVFFCCGPAGLFRQ